MLVHAQGENKIMKCEASGEEGADHFQSAATVL